MTMDVLWTPGTESRHSDDDEQLSWDREQKAAVVLSAFHHRVLFFSGMAYRPKLLKLYDFPYVKPIRYNACNKSIRTRASSCDLIIHAGGYRRGVSMASVACVSLCVCLCIRVSVCPSVGHFSIYRVRSFTFSTIFGHVVGLQYCGD